MAEPDFGTWLRATAAPYLLHVSASFSLVCIVVWIFRYRDGLGWSGSTLFNWHPLLLTLAFVLVLPEAVLMFRFANLKRATARTMHISLQTFALLFAFAGFAAVFKFHEDIGAAHFKSLHSWLGLACLSALVLQYCVVGFGLFYSNKWWCLALPTTATFTARREMHRYFGMALVLLSLLALVTGLQEKAQFTNMCGKQDDGECALVNSSALLFALTIMALGVAMTLSFSSRAVSSSSPQPLLLPRDDESNLLDSINTL